MVVRVDVQRLRRGVRLQHPDDIVRTLVGILGTAARPLLLGQLGQGRLMTTAPAAMSGKWSRTGEIWEPGQTCQLLPAGDGG